jgi:hypothetical protein
MDRVAVDVRCASHDGRRMLQAGRHGWRGGSAFEIARLAPAAQVRAMVGCGVPSDLVLLAAADAEEADRYASALIQTDDFGFVFAHDAATAATHAANMAPDLAIISLGGDEGVRLSPRLRAVCGPHKLSIVLVVDAKHLAAARDALANAIVVKPASSLLVAVEANNVRRRVERRALARGDRRTMFRGGRRFTDIASG